MNLFMTSPQKSLLFGRYGFITAIGTKGARFHVSVIERHHFYWEYKLHWFLLALM